MYPQVLHSDVEAIGRGLAAAIAGASLAASLLAVVLAMLALSWRVPSIPSMASVSVCVCVRACVRACVYARARVCLIVRETN